ncbi:MAG: NAD-dependent epimerase/dehydratase family protein [bacterium]|nr:NAD-dependent epimerase/dehydratase family protein [bacterium]
MINPKEKLNGKKILVTGGAGFIGSHLCDHLLAYGARVICFDNLSTGSQRYVDSKKGDKDFTFILGDANKFENLEPVFADHKPDYVFHYAALVGVRRTEEDPMGVLNDIEGIKHISKLSSKHGVKKIVYASSSEVYGNQKELPFSEESSYHDTRHPYALVKATGESYFKSYSAITGIPVTSLRFFNTYGPRQASTPYGFVVGIFISQVLSDLRPTIFRDGTQTRDFTYIDDNVEAAIQALLNDKANGQALNIGTGVETSVLELANKIVAISGKELKPNLLRHINLVETQRRVADASKLKNLVGYQYQTSLVDGLKITHDWYRDNPEFILTEQNSDQYTYEDYERKVWKSKEE